MYHTAFICRASRFQPGDFDCILSFPKTKSKLQRLVPEFTLKCFFFSRRKVFGVRIVTRGYRFAPCITDKSRQTAFGLARALDFPPERMTDFFNGRRFET